ncbi:elongation of very long chain fatty acids protein 4-like [Dendronephthya gigantea]|uniref:elongation of very long chain fatty acids protein 4-like n=1 Tax=Dendronephthya gigantea TaxID=151771 RepID=UPI00106B27BD|nr:elongation of very long chain fatty acids protein 4-like [Dendronephthya gigantea]XP_028408669.1 elongation of very long chain fatty acids protein 4-like [Dendronephthya gigantea]
MGFRLLTKTVFDFYDRAINDGDQRTSKWFLMSTPWTVLSLLFFYILLVIVGQRIMRKRDSFDIKNILIIYNSLLVILSLYMLREFIFSVTSTPDFNYFCQGVEQGENTNLLRHANANWLFLISKIVEFLDTVFLIVSKKPVSFLHIYHHNSVCLLWWIIVKWHPGGTTYFGAVLNCFVHAVMYFYYLLSALGPRFKKYLWWKRYLTSLQLLQFSMVFVYVTNAMTVKDCDYPHWLLWIFVGYDISLIILFGNFYFQEYLKKNKKKMDMKSN